MVTRAPENLWIVDPDDPRAPPTDIWNAMTPEERKRVEDSLPGAREISASLRRFVDDIDQRLTAAQERAAEEARLRAEVEQKLEVALAEIARLEAELLSGGGRSSKE